MNQYWLLLQQQAKLYTGKTVIFNASFTFIADKGHQYSNMKSEKRVPRLIMWVAMICCLLVLSKFILFKKSPGYYRQYFTHGYHAYSIKEGWKHANTKPFSSIRLLSGRYVTSAYSYKNIGGNIVGFIPVGLLLPLLLPVFRNFFAATGMVLLISLLFELLQLVGGLGSFDVDDLILNTAGGIAGYLLYKLFARR